MDAILDAVEVRVLGSLVEKEITTPEYYPLTLNALINACNQKSNRDPEVRYDEETVSSALDSLREKKLIARITGAGIRVPKYAHRFSEALNLGRREMAILCELMLRNRQTTGELRSRTERMHSFADISEVESCLQRLMEREPRALVTRLPRQTGTKEARYAHLLSGEMAAEEKQDSPNVPVAEPRVSGREERIVALEAEVNSLRQEVDDLHEQFAEFRKQFE